MVTFVNPDQEGKKREHLASLFHPCKHVLHSKNCHLHIGVRRNQLDASVNLRDGKFGNSDHAQTNPKYPLHLRLHAVKHTSFLASMPSWLSPLKKSADCSTPPLKQFFL